MKGLKIKGKVIVPDKLIAPEGHYKGSKVIKNDIVKKICPTVDKKWK